MRFRSLHDSSSGRFYRIKVITPPYSQYECTQLVVCNSAIVTIKFKEQRSFFFMGEQRRAVSIKDVDNAVQAHLNQRWPHGFLVSIDLISSFVVGISGGEILSARKPISSSVGITSSRPAISPQIVTGLPEASAMMMPSNRSMDGWVSS